MTRSFFSKVNDVREGISSSLPLVPQPSQVVTVMQPRSKSFSLVETARQASTAATENCDPYSSNDKLSDGRVLELRAIQPGDKPVLSEGMHHLSKTSRYRRFFTHKDELSEAELAFLTELDFAHHVALLATVVDGERKHPAGVGRYVVLTDDVRSAELAFAVVEEYQGLGVATVMLQHLITIAKTHGIERLIASVLPENKAMKKVFYKSGLPITEIVNSVDVLEISLSLK